MGFFDDPYEQAVNEINNQLREEEYQRKRKQWAEEAKQKDLKKCPECLGLIPPEARKCMHCGSPQKIVEPKAEEPSINCKKCSTKITLSISGTKCWKCGNLNNSSG